MPRSQMVDVRSILKGFAALVVVALLFTASAATAQVTTTQISSDDFSNTSSQHQTEVEPDSHAHGTTVVAVFQIGRFTDGGSSDIGFATSSNSGATWTHGHLPGLTTIEGSGPYDRASDPSVTYNEKYKLWLAETLGLNVSGGVHGQAVLVSSSKDGVTWNNPAVVSDAGRSGFYDKPWIGCDNTSTSPFYGNCYVAWDDFNLGDQLEMSTSTDGGATWSTKKTTSGNHFGTGGNPLIQPSGTVIVPAGDQFLSTTLAFKSTDGGSTWSSPVTISTISEHGVAGGMRAVPLPASVMDDSGKAYIVWADCRFRKSCASNDIVMSTSTDGTTWTTVARIPIDGTGSTADHFTPGISIKPGTSGSTARIALTYNFFPKASCTNNCSLSVGYVESTNGGATWSAPKLLATGINPNWLPSTTSGQMVGDYQTTSYPGTRVHGVFATASANVGSTFSESMQTNAAGLPIPPADGPQFSSAKDKPVRYAHSDVPRRTKPHRDDGVGERD